MAHDWHTLGAFSGRWIGFEDGELNKLDRLTSLDDDHLESVGELIPVECCEPDVIEGGVFEQLPVTLEPSDDVVMIERFVGLAS